MDDAEMIPSPMDVREFAAWAAAALKTNGRKELRFARGSVCDQIKSNGRFEDVVADIDGAGISAREDPPTGNLIVSLCKPDHMAIVRDFARGES